MITQRAWRYCWAALHFSSTSTTASSFNEQTYHKIIGHEDVEVSTFIGGPYSLTAARCSSSSAITVQAQPNLGSLINVGV